MLIRVSNHEDLAAQALARVKVLKEKLQEATEEGDSLVCETLRAAINHLKDIKKAAKLNLDIFLDEDDRFVLDLKLGAE